VNTTSHSPTADAPSSRAVGAGLFLLSATVLTLEVLQTRILAYCMSPLLLYTAIGVTLLGMGASASLMSLWDGWRRFQVGTLGAIGAGGFAATAIASHRVLAKMSPQLADFSSPLHMRLGLDLFLLCAALATPYFFAGIAVTACLATSRRVHGTYFLNLLGSALGCFGVALLMQPLSAPVLLGVVAALGAVAGIAFLCAGAHVFGGLATGAGLALALAAVWRPNVFYWFQPDPAGQLAVLQAKWAEAPGQPQYRTVWSSWDVTGHVGFHELPGVPALLPEPLPAYFYAQDGSAGSMVLGVGDDPARARHLYERTLYGAAHQLRGAPGADVLVIGLGGAPDVMCAHHYQAKSVTGVDINGSTIAALRGPLSAFAGNPYNRANVEIERMDGRTFVRSTARKFDVIVMSGADTKSVHAAGSLAISENHLYTVEAFVEYLEHLTDSGVLAIARFGPFDRLKLSSIGIAALRRRGIEHPERHFVVLAQDTWTSVVMARQPIDAGQLQRMRAWVASVPESLGMFLPHYDPIGFGLTTRPSILYPSEAAAADGTDVGGLFAAAAAGREAEFIAAQRENIAPTTDDRPFYFDQTKPEDALRAPTAAYKLLANLLLVLAALAALFIALPVPALRRAARGSGLLRSLLYFGSLGLGFMLLEIGLIQKLCLLLGHQSYAITVVLATLLVGAGLGSAAAGAMGLGRAAVRFVVIPLLIAAAWTIMLGLERYGEELAARDLPVRIAFTAVGLLPLGFLLGMPFPTALARAERSVVPWAIAANGFTSVIGASAALPLAMLLGYRWLFLIACGTYALALLVFPRPATASRPATQVLPAGEGEPDPGLA